MTEEPQPPAARSPGSSSTHRPRWRLILGDGTSLDGAATHPGPGPENMAIDQALLDAVAAGAEPVVRLYRWTPATLSFGRNQPARDLYDAAAAAERGIEFVRRPTGGQAVLHDDELTYAVVAPVAVVGKPRAAYERINEAIVVALRGVGVEAGVASPAQVQGHGHGQGQGHGQGHGAPRGGWTEACFRRAERGEVVAGGRKLVGSAQRTQSRTILQHGSVLLGGTQAPAEALLLTSSGEAGGGPEARAAREPGWTTVESELGRRPSVESLARALVSGFEDVVGISLARSTLTPEEGAGAAALRGRFASPAWTWRR